MNICENDKLYFIELRLYKFDFLIKFEIVQYLIHSIKYNLGHFNKLFYVHISTTIFVCTYSNLSYRVDCDTQCE